MPGKDQDAGALAPGLAVTSKVVEPGVEGAAGSAAGQFCRWRKAESADCRDGGRERCADHRRNFLEDSRPGRRTGSCCRRKATISAEHCAAGLTWTLVKPTEQTPYHVSADFGGDGQPLAGDGAARGEADVERQGEGRSILCVGGAFQQAGTITVKMKPEAA